MGVIQSFPTDVFLSYARRDNQVRRGSIDDEWVAGFRDDLSQALGVRFGQDAAVWMDDGLKRSEEFDAEIPDQLKESAVLVAVVSPSFVKSEYCQKELGWFAKHAKDSPFGLKLKNHRRIMPILIYNVPPKERPKPCQGVEGGQFFDASSRAKLKGPVKLDSDKYREEIERLADEIFELIGEMKDKEPSSPSVEGNDPKSVRKTFAKPIEEFEVVLNESPELKNALIRDYRLDPETATADLAEEIALQINANFASWLFERLLRIPGAKREAIQRAASVSVFLAMSPTFAAEVRKQASETGTGARVINVPSNAGKAVLAMIRAWAVGADEGLAADDDEDHVVESAECGPDMTSDSIKRILCEKLEIPWEASDRDQRLKGALLAEKSSFSPFYLVEEDRTAIDLVMKDPALTFLFVLIRAKEASLIRGEDSVAYVEAVERLLNKFQQRMKK